MAVAPLYDRVLVKRIDKFMTEGGLHIPEDSVANRSKMCEVVAVGSGRVFSDGTVGKMELKVGDKILIGAHNWVEVTLKKEKFLFVREQNVLGVLEDS